MKNIIAGGAGFIGSSLIRKLLNSGEKVICLDNFITGKKSNISHLLSNPNFELIEHDITIPIDLEADRIWHLACPASPKHYQRRPLNTSITSFNGTLNLLNIAKNNNAKLLFASSSEVYGNPEKHPQKEDYFGNVNPISKRACYEEGKRISETLCYDFYREYKTDICIARIFNTYGPWMVQDDGRVVSNFILQALKEDFITINGDGKQTRSFCYIDDLVSGLIKLMNTDYINPLNLGNDEEVTIIELGNLIKKKINSKIIFKQLTLPEDDPLRRKPNIELAKSVLNWEPKVTLFDGLDKTIAYFKQLNLN